VLCGCLIDRGGPGAGGCRSVRKALARPVEAQSAVAGPRVGSGATEPLARRAAPASGLLLHPGRNSRPPWGRCRRSCRTGCRRAHTPLHIPGPQSTGSERTRRIRTCPSSRWSNRPRRPRQVLQVVCGTWRHPLCEGARTGSGAAHEKGVAGTKAASTPHGCASVRSCARNAAGANRVAKEKGPQTGVRGPLPVFDACAFWSGKTNWRLNPGRNQPDRALRGMGGVSPLFWPAPAWRPS
jgi:hypothetical protein